MPNFLKTALREMSRNLLVLVALVGMTTVAFAFTEPSAGPTGGTVYAPINTSATSQTKSGNFTSSGTVTGNILNAITQVSSPQYCIGVSCITAWPSSSSLSGSGTLNKVPKFTPNGTTLGDSQIFDNGTSVGIGTASPSEKLDINGSVYVGSNWYKAGNITSVNNAISVWGAEGGMISGFASGRTVAMGQTTSGFAGFGISSGSTPLGSFYYDHLGDSAVVQSYGSGRKLVLTTDIGTGNILFRTNNIDRMTINSSGNVGIGTMNPQDKLHVAGGAMVDSDIRINRSTRATIYPSGPSVPANLDLQIRSAGTGVLQLNSDNGGPVTIGNGGGSVGIGVFPSWRLQLGVDSAGKPNGGSWGNSSDERLKTTIVPLNGALKKLTALRGVQFEWKNPGEHASYLGEVRAGFIAQEVEEIFPQFVSEIDASGKDRELTVDGRIKTLTLPFDFDAYLVEAIKELQAEIDVLKAENQMLKERVESLEGR